MSALESGYVAEGDAVEGRKCDLGDRRDLCVARELFSIDANILAYEALSEGRRA